MKRALLIAVAITLTAVASAWAADTGTITQRIPTKRSTAVRHVYDHVGLGHDIIATHATNIRCVASKLVHGRSKTWKCSFRYRDTRLRDSAPLQCRARYRIGLERRIVNGNDTGRAWNDHKLGSKVCRRV